DRGHALGLLRDDRGEARDLGGLLRPLERLRARRDDVERRPELVGDPGGELADRGEALGAAEVLRGALELGGAALEEGLRLGEARGERVRLARALERAG